MDKLYIGSRVGEFFPGLETLPITKVELVDENGDIKGEAGNNTGRTLTATNPDGTDAMAADILSAVSGFVYKPYEGEDALIDPSAELGDGITAGGVYSLLAQENINFDDLYSANIAAPTTDEIEDEYPYISPIERQIQRNYNRNYSLITKTAEQIRLEVASVEDAVSYLEIDLDSITGRVKDAEGNIATLELTSTQLRSEISGKIDGDYAQTLIDQSLDSIELSVSSSGGSTTFKLTGGGAELSTQTLSLSVNAVNITGQLTIGQLSNEVATEDQIPIYTSELINNSGFQTERGVTAIINGTVTTDYVNALAISARKLKGQTVDLVTSGNRVVGGLEIAYTTTGYGLGISTSYGGIQITSAGGNIYLQNGNGQFLQLGGNDGLCYLGGGPLAVGSASYGTRLPSTGTYGQVFFLLE